MASYQDAFNKKQKKKQKSFKEKFREEKDKGSKTFEYPKGSGKMFSTRTRDEVEAGRKSKNVGVSSDYSKVSYQDAPKPRKIKKDVSMPSVQSTASMPVNNRVKGTTNVKTEPKKRGSVFRGDGKALRGFTKGRLV